MPDSVAVVVMNSFSTIIIAHCAEHLYLWCSTCTLNEHVFTLLDVVLLLLKHYCIPKHISYISTSASCTCKFQYLQFPCMLALPPNSYTCKFQAYQIPDFSNTYKFHPIGYTSKFRYLQIPPLLPILPIPANSAPSVPCARSESRIGRTSAAQGECLTLTVEWSAQ